MSDDPDKELLSARPQPGSKSSDVYSSSTLDEAPASLLDLVRAAEEEATVGATRKTAGATRLPSPRAPSPQQEDEFVDVGDEAIDAPPSLPPMRSVSPVRPTSPPTAKKSSRPPSAAVASRAPASRPPPHISAVPHEERGRSLPPAFAIALMFALAIAALAILAR